MSTVDESATRTDAVGGTLAATGDGMPAAPAAVSVFGAFRAFWGEVDAARATALRSAAPRPATSGPGLDPVTGQALSHLATTIHGRLLSFLAAQASEASRADHGAGRATWREAQFVMAALADDIFVQLEWSGAAWWLWNPLETAIFGTRVAGRRVFSRIDEITRAADPADRELATVYLAALSLGFEGEYAGTGNGAALDEYRRRLRHFILGDRDVLQGPVVAQCYAHTDVSGRRPLLPSAGVWWWAAAAVVALWIAVSSVLWGRATAPIAAAAGDLAATPSVSAAATDASASSTASAGITP